MEGEQPVVLFLRADVPGRFHFRFHAGIAEKLALEDEPISLGDDVEEKMLAAAEPYLALDGAVKLHSRRI